MIEVTWQKAEAEKERDALMQNLKEQQEHEKQLEQQKKQVCSIMGGVSLIHDIFWSVTLLLLINIDTGE